jgi:hypothetical protein
LLKTIVGMVALFVIATVGIYYGSCYVMGGIEGGMHDGGHGKFADHHEGNVITDYFQNKNGNSTSDFSSGDVTSNPFTD